MVEKEFEGDGWLGSGEGGRLTIQRYLTIFAYREIYAVWIIQDVYAQLILIKFLFKT
jgi:hypothetical protein